jgi:TRAP-type C4-dicarboxylate transport system substrate-binding protein
MEQQVVRAVGDGRADLGWTGTRIFDTLGVRGFDALTAPMLIDSYALERAVIESDLPARMLPGLKPLGVTGLAVLGGGLRKPIAVGRPLLGPSDWHGRRFGVFRSAGAAAAVRALGARPTNVWGGALQDAVAEHAIDGFEKHYLIWDLVIDPAAARYVTTNVNLWPETTALLANTARLARLDDEQRGWLARAASDAAVRSTSLFADESSAVRRLCGEGARFATASGAQLAALRRALAPAYSRLERNPQTRDLIGRIAGMKAGTLAARPAAIPPGCTRGAPVAPAASGAETTADALDGVYRIRLTDRELTAAGPIAAFSRPSFGGLITLALHRGRFRFRPRTPPECTGRYGFAAGGIVRFRVEPRSFCQGVVTARYRLAGGSLRLHVIASTNPYDAVVWGGKPWRRIA